MCACVQTLAKIRSVLQAFKVKPLQRPLLPQSASAKLPALSTLLAASTPMQAASGRPATPAGVGKRLTGLYLTTSRLFGVQMATPEFRCHFIVQCLILLQSYALPSKKNEKDALKARQVWCAAGCASTTGFNSAIMFDEALLCAVACVDRHSSHLVCLNWCSCMCLLGSIMPAGGPGLLSSQDHRRRLLSLI